MNKKIEDVVLELLNEHKRLRADDFLLYCAVCKRLGVDTNRPFKDVLSNHDVLKLPSFETVTRCRRKLQEIYQNLVDVDMAVKRAEQREKMIEYSREWR